MRYWNQFKDSLSIYLLVKANFGFGKFAILTRRDLVAIFQL